MKKESDRQNIWQNVWQSVPSAIIREFESYSLTAELIREPDFEFSLRQLPEVSAPVLISILLSARVLEAHVRSFLQSKEWRVGKELRCHCPVTSYEAFQFSGARGERRSENIYFDENEIAAQIALDEALYSSIVDKFWPERIQVQTIAAGDVFEDYSIGAVEAEAWNAVVDWYDELLRSTDSEGLANRHPTEFPNDYSEEYKSFKVKAFTRNAIRLFPVMVDQAMPGIGTALRTTYGGSQGVAARIIVEVLTNAVDCLRNPNSFHQLCENKELPDLIDFRGICNWVSDGFPNV